MNFNDLLINLKSSEFDLIDVVKKQKLSQLETNLESIVQEPQSFEELKNNMIANVNFFTLLSHIYLVEQNKQQNLAEPDKPAESARLFDITFVNRVNELAKSHEFTQELFK